MSNKKLKVILPAIIIVMLVVGLGAVMLFMRVPSQGVQAKDVFQDDVYVEDSDAGGTVSVSTVLLDDLGNEVRRTVPEDYVLPYLILDPVTGKEVSEYSIEIGFDCWGTNIDWTTFSLSGVWKYTTYIGVTDTGSAWPVSKDIELGFQTTPPVEVAEWVGGGAQETIMGVMIFPPVVLATLMDDTISFQIVDENLQKVTVIYDQKTSWSHTFTFVFDADFTLSVNDDWGNTYDSSYNMHVVLKLLWDGSDFGVEWNPDPTPTTTTETPTTTTIPIEKTLTPTVTIDPIDDPGDPLVDLASKESIYLDNTKTVDAIAAAFTGAVGSMMLVVGIVLILVPVMIYYFMKKR